MRVGPAAREGLEPLPPTPPLSPSVPASPARGRVGPKRDSNQAVEGVGLGQYRGRAERAPKNGARVRGGGGTGRCCCCWPGCGGASCLAALPQPGRGAASRCQPRRGGTERASHCADPISIWRAGGRQAGLRPRYRFRHHAGAAGAHQQRAVAARDIASRPAPSSPRSPARWRIRSDHSQVDN